MDMSLMPTKAGKGFKAVVEGRWFYTSIDEMGKMLNKKANACIFREIKECE